MSIINFFSNNKYKLLKRNVKIDETSGASISTWTFDKEVSGYYEPIETLVGSEIGDKFGITGVLYCSEKLVPAYRLEINGSLFEIREVEFWQLRGLSYYKGYLVKTDENL